MPVRLITYDLRQPGQDYSGLSEAIKRLGTWLHYQESVWMVETTLNCNQVLQTLKSHLNARDSLLVTTLGDGAATGLSVSANTWLRSSMK